MNVLLEDKANQQILLVLFNNSCCLRCILRVLRVESLDMYRGQVPGSLTCWATLSDITKAEVNLLTQYNILKLIKKGDDEICRLCLGLLQDCDNPDHIQMIGEAIKSQKFEF